MRLKILSLAALALGTATPAFAQDEDTDPPKDFTVSGGVTIVSDYRFRGLTRTDTSFAPQATINVNSKTGFYAGVWASLIDGGPDGSTPALTGYGNAEVDIYGGYTTTFSNGVGVDVGLLYYYYPSAASGLNTDFFEPYASVTYTIGPVGTKVGVAYAWGGQSGLNFTAGKDDNVYAYGEASIGIPKTPITLKGHVGYTSGSLGLANLNPGDSSYVDWSLTAEVVQGKFKAGLSYVDTDVTSFANFDGRLGRGPAVIGYVGWSF